MIRLLRLLKFNRRHSHSDAELDREIAFAEAQREWLRSHEHVEREFELEEWLGARGVNDYRDQSGTHLHDLGSYLEGQSVDGPRWRGAEMPLWTSTMAAHPESRERPMSYFDSIKHDPDLVEQWRKSGFEIGIGRTTTCDRCGETRRGCIWVKRENDESATRVLCPSCRAVWRREGVAFVNGDADFPEVV